MQIVFHSFFKIFGFLLGIFTFFLILIVINAFTNKQKELKNFNFIEGDKNSENSIYILNLRGPIVNETLKFRNLSYESIITPEKIDRYLKEIKNSNPKIIIIKINSPGGTVSATSNIYNILNNFNKNNNVKIYFYTNEILASGAYWIAQAGDKIYANYGSLIGSIGVKGPDWIYFNKPIAMSYGLFGNSIETKNGIEIYSQSAGKSKDFFNPYRKPTDEELMHLNQMAQNIYSDFVKIVSKNRKIENKILINEVGALIYDSISAKDNFLLDDVIDFKKLIKKIIKENNFDSYKLIENQIINFSIFNQLMIKIQNNRLNNTNFEQEKFICNKIRLNISSVAPNYFKNC